MNKRERKAYEGFAHLLAPVPGHNEDLPGPGMEIERGGLPDQGLPFQIHQELVFPHPGREACGEKDDG
jgi:hypothetical protein